MLEQITIGESMNGVFASEHRSEQGNIIATKRVESPATVAVEGCRFAQGVEFMVSLCRIIDDRQGLKISLVRDHADLGKAREVCRALGHRETIP